MHEEVFIDFITLSAIWNFYLGVLIFLIMGTAHRFSTSSRVYSSLDGPQAGDNLEALASHKDMISHYYYY